jgi:hypothetical protein
MRVVSKNWCCFGFDEVTDPGIGKTSAQGPNRRRRENDVANEPWPDEEDFH